MYRAYKHDFKKVRSKVDSDMDEEIKRVIKELHTMIIEHRERVKVTCGIQCICWKLESIMHLAQVYTSLKKGGE